MADKAILQNAFETIDSETIRQVAVRSLKSLEAALQDAERDKQLVICQQATTAGKAAKPIPYKN
jgi:hypothetical protein